MVAEDMSLRLKRDLSSLLQPAFEFKLKLSCHKEDLVTLVFLIKLVLLIEGGTVYF